MGMLTIGFTTTSTATCSLLGRMQLPRWRLHNRLLWPHRAVLQAGLLLELLERLVLVLVPAVADIPLLQVVARHQYQEPLFRHWLQHRPPP